jgi:hypothetical protein
MFCLFEVSFVDMQSTNCRPVSLIVPGFMLLCATGIFPVVDDIEDNYHSLHSKKKAIDGNRAIICDSSLMQ